MINEKSNSNNITGHDDEAYLRNYTCLFKKVHKFKTNTEIKIHVYQGAKEFGNQIIPFRLACNIISSTASFEVVHLTTCDVNKYKLSEMDIINWLLEGDIHFILTHIHQGIVNINMNKLYSSISKLHDHPGFPSGDSLQCPVFTQDKYKYLTALMPKGMCNPTFKVDFLPSMDYDLLKQELCKFIKDNDEGYGWIVKTPFSTNSHNKQWARSLEDLMSRIKSQYDKLSESIPYTMVQATMKNKKEYKVVLFNREARYVCILKHGCGTSFSEKPHTKVMNFAMEALQEFASACPNALVDSLMRVDIFQTMAGKLVVNEFESLEADHHSPFGDGDKLEVDDNVRNYYESILRSILDEKHFRP